MGGPVFATSGEELDRYLGIRGHGTPLARPYPNMQGSKAQLQPGGRAQLLRVEALSEALARVDPTLITLHLSAIPLPNVDAVPPGVNSRTVAEVQWGCGGGTHAAIVDVGRGTTLQLTADFIDIAAVYLGPPGGIVPIAALGPVVQYAATAVYGARSGAQSAPTVTYTDPVELSDAAPVLGLIPPFAKSVNLLLSDPLLLRSGALTITLEVSPDLSFAVPAGIVLGAPEYATRYAVPWALRPDAQFIRVSLVGARSVPAWLVYELALLPASGWLGGAGRSASRMRLDGCGSKRCSSPPASRRGSSWAWSWSPGGSTGRA